MNTTVYATNMQVKATAGPSLVISASTNFTAGTTEVSFTGTDITVMPATKWVSGMKDGTGSHTTIATQTASASVSGLVYVANGGDINPATGLTFVDVDDGAGGLEARPTYYTVAATASENGSTVGYYYDYIIYLAAEGDDDIDSGKLQISIPALTLDADEEILKAVTVQVLVGDAAVGDPLHLNVANNNVEIVSDLSTTNIVHGAPGTVSGALKVTLRVYVDGAYQDVTDTSTYVRNNNIVDLTRAASFNVTFDVVNA